MRRVLLTGASGLLGAHFLKYASNNSLDWEFVCPYTFRNQGNPERLGWAVGCTRTDLEFVLHDCATPVGKMTAEKFDEPDLIINFASDTHPPRSVLHPVEFMHNNVDITLYLLEYARKLRRPPTFIQISTNSVYGPAMEGTSHPEWDSIIPNNPYGASKVAQEALAISYWCSYNLPVILINTMNPLGETQDTEKFIPNTIKKVLNGETIEIHANAAGEVGKRTYIDAQEVAAAIHHIIGLREPVLRGADVDRPDRWHVAGRQEIDNLEVATIIADELHLPLKVKTHAVDRPEHGHRYSLNASKLAATGWSASRTIEPTIRRIARWTAEHPEWVL